MSSQQDQQRPPPSDYGSYIAGKLIAIQPAGFECREPINEHLFDFQRDIVRWALRRGRAAIFAGTGLGKTLMELSWAHEVNKHTNSPIILLTPLAVAAQIVEEADKFGIPAKHVKHPDDITAGINVTNYEKLGRFDVSQFAGIVLDESSILKNMDGKTRTQLIECFGNYILRKPIRNLLI